MDTGKCVDNLFWVVDLEPFPLSNGAAQYPGASLWCIGNSSLGCRWSSIPGYLADGHPDTYTYRPLELFISTADISEAFQMGHTPAGGAIMRQLESLRITCSNPIHVYAPYVLEPLVMALSAAGIDPGNSTAAVAASPPPSPPPPSPQPPLPSGSPPSSASAVAAVNASSAGGGGGGVYFSRLYMPPALPESRLRRLAINNCTLTGQLPPDTTWLQLPNLEVLDLSVNQLSGPLPATLGPSPPLRYVNLSHNRIVGPLATDWARYGGCGRTLDLSYNDLRGDLPDAWIGSACSQRGKGGSIAVLGTAAAASRRRHLSRSQRRWRLQQDQNGSYDGAEFNGGEESPPQPAAPAATLVSYTGLGAAVTARDQASNATAGAAAGGAPSASASAGSLIGSDSYAFWLSYSTLSSAYGSDGCLLYGVAWKEEPAARARVRLRDGGGAEEPFPFTVLLYGNPNLRAPGGAAAGYATAVTPRLYFSVRDNACTAFQPLPELLWLWGSFGGCALAILGAAAIHGITELRRVSSKVAPVPAAAAAGTAGTPAAGSAHGPPSTTAAAAAAPRAAEKGGRGSRASRAAVGPPGAGSSVAAPAGPGKRTAAGGGGGGGDGGGGNSVVCVRANCDVAQPAGLPGPSGRSGSGSGRDSDRASRRDGAQGRDGSGLGGAGSMAGRRGRAKADPQQHSQRDSRKDSRQGLWEVEERMEGEGGSGGGVGRRGEVEGRGRGKDREGEGVEVEELTELGASWSDDLGGSSGNGGGGGGGGGGAGGSGGSGGGSSDLSRDSGGRGRGGGGGNEGADASMAGTPALALTPQSTTTLLPSNGAAASSAAAAASSAAGGGGSGGGGLARIIIVAHARAYSRRAVQQLTMYGSRMASTSGRMCRALLYGVPWGPLVRAAAAVAVHGTTAGLTYALAQPGRVAYCANVAGCGPYLYVVPPLLSALSLGLTLFLMRATRQLAATMSRRVAAASGGGGGKAKDTAGASAAGSPAPSPTRAWGSVDCSSRGHTHSSELDAFNSGAEDEAASGRASPMPRRHTLPGAVPACGVAAGGGGVVLNPGQRLAATAAGGGGGGGLYHANSTGHLAPQPALLQPPPAAAAPPPQPSFIAFPRLRSSHSSNASPAAPPLMPYRRQARPPSRMGPGPGSAAASPPRVSPSQPGALLWAASSAVAESSSAAAAADAAPGSPRALAAPSPFALPASAALVAAAAAAAESSVAAAVEGVAALLPGLLTEESPHAADAVGGSLHSAPFSDGGGDNSGGCAASPQSPGPPLRWPCASAPVAGAWPAWGLTACNASPSRGGVGGGSAASCGDGTSASGGGGGPEAVAPGSGIACNRVAGGPVAEEAAGFPAIAEQGALLRRPSSLSQRVEGPAPGGLCGEVVGGDAPGAVSVSVGGGAKEAEARQGGREVTAPGVTGGGKPGLSWGLSWLWRGWLGTAPAGAAAAAATAAPAGAALVQPFGESTTSALQASVYAQVPSHPPQCAAPAPAPAPSSPRDPAAPPTPPPPHLSPAVPSGAVASSSNLDPWPPAAVPCFVIPAAAAGNGSGGGAAGGSGFLPAPLRQPRLPSPARPAPRSEGSVQTTAELFFPLSPPLLWHWQPLGDAARGGDGPLLPHASAPVALSPGPPRLSDLGPSGPGPTLGTWAYATPFDGVAVFAPGPLGEARELGGSTVSGSGEGAGGGVGNGGCGTGGRMSSSQGAEPAGGGGGGAVPRRFRDKWPVLLGSEAGEGGGGAGGSSAAAATSGGSVAAEGEGGGAGGKAGPAARASQISQRNPQEAPGQRPSSSISPHHHTSPRKSNTTSGGGGGDGDGAGHPRGQTTPRPIQASLDTQLPGTPAPAPPAPAASSPSSSPSKQQPQQQPTAKPPQHSSPRQAAAVPSPHSPSSPRHNHEVRQLRLGSLLALMDSGLGASAAPRADAAAAAQPPTPSPPPPPAAGRPLLRSSSAASRGSRSVRFWRDSNGPDGSCAGSDAGNGDGGGGRSGDSWDGDVGEGAVASAEHREAHGGGELRHGGENGGGISADLPLSGGDASPGRYSAAARRALSFVGVPSHPGAHKGGTGAAEGDASAHRSPSRLSDHTFAGAVGPAQHPAQDVSVHRSQPSVGAILAPAATAAAGSPSAADLSVHRSQASTAALASAAAGRAGQDPAAAAAAAATASGSWRPPLAVTVPMFAAALAANAAASAAGTPAAVSMDTGGSGIVTVGGGGESPGFKRNSAWVEDQLAALRAASAAVAASAEPSVTARLPSVAAAAAVAAVTGSALPSPSPRRAPRQGLAAVPAGASAVSTAATPRGSPKRGGRAASGGGGGLRGLKPAALQVVNEYLRDCAIGKPGSGWSARCRRAAASAGWVLAWGAAAPAVFGLLAAPAAAAIVGHAAARGSQRAVARARGALFGLRRWWRRRRRRRHTDPGSDSDPDDGAAAGGGGGGGAGGGSGRLDAWVASLRRDAALFLGLHTHVAAWVLCIPLALFTGTLYGLGYQWGADAVPSPPLFLAANAACLGGTLLLLLDLAADLPAWEDGVCRYPYAVAMSAVAPPQAPLAPPPPQQQQQQRAASPQPPGGAE